MMIVLLNGIMIVLLNEVMIALFNSVSAFFHAIQSIA